MVAFGGNGEIVTVKWKYDRLMSVFESFGPLSALLFKSEAPGLQSGPERKRLDSKQDIRPANKKQPCNLTVCYYTCNYGSCEKEDIVVEESDVSDIELNFAAKQAYEVLKPTMRSICVEYDVPFQWLLETVTQSGEDLIDGV